MKLSPLIITLLLGLNCSTAQKDVNKSVTNKEQNLKTVVLHIEQNDLQESKNEMLYKPGRRRKQARYKTYHFDLESFRKMTAGTKYPIDLKVNIVSEKSKSIELNPNMSQPIGGFKYIHYFCEPIEIVK